MSDTQSATSSGKGFWLILLLLSVAVAFAGLQAGRFLGGPSTIQLQAQPDCDLVAGCALTAGNRTIQLQFSQAPASHQRFIATATLSGFDKQPVVLDLKGVEMFMGLNRYKLRRQSDGLYRGEIQLPVCSSGRMQWQAHLLIGEEDALTTASYTFWAQ